MTHDSGDGQLDIQTKQDIYDHYDAVTMVGEGERDGYPALIISVEPGSGLGPADLPETVQGLPVRVEEREEMPDFQQANHQLHDPIRGGQIITNTTRQAYGTSSFIMTDGNDAYASSNYHVLTPDGSGNVGDQVGHLEFNDNGNVSGNQLIGEVDGYIDRTGNSATADFAWVELNSGINATNRIAGLGLVTDTGTVSTGDTVIKSGSTTALTEGDVDQVGAVVGVNGSDITMQNQVLSDMPADGGDSGSPVMEKGTSTAVGVLWGGDSSGSAYSPISNIENNCPLTVATSEPDQPEPNEKPNADWSYSTSPLRIDIDASASSDPDGQITRYEWDFGDGTVKTGESGWYGYDSAGSYQVMLTVTDNDGATDAFLRQVDIPPEESDPEPDPDPDPDPDPGECTHNGYPRSEWGYSGTDQSAFASWQSCEYTTEEFAFHTSGGDGTASLIHPDDVGDSPSPETSGVGAILALGVAGAYLRKRMD